MKRLAALIAVCLSLFIAPVFAQYDSERITDYKSDITVARNGVLNVTETIAVIAAGDRIRHADFGEGRVVGVTGQAPKAVAEVQFERAGRKRLLIKIAPIEKL